ncbi:MAG: hypothetical protein MJA83_16580 [Gammaproteobacteria bacterium]|nr:hypothetical protein [Gammaproteobacteria bacterium]
MSITAKALISEKLKEKGLSESMVGEMSYKYVCMDTGMYFETYDGHAMYSPYTGSTNIGMAGAEKEMASPMPPPYYGEAVDPSQYMAPRPIPSNHQDPYTQNPVSPNPAPAQPADTSWMNTPWTPNPAPDVQGRVGADDADPSGYVPYPGNDVPPHKKKTPGDRTDLAPAGSK